MAKKFADLRRGMSPEAQKMARAKTEELAAALPLAELRHARQLSQSQLAEELSIKQPAVAKIEKKADMYISTLRRVVKAMGGELEINARFSDGVVRINQFEEIDDKKTPSAA